MIDLVSTRNVDNQTRACARLLGAVIAQAVQDAATPFSVYTDKEGKPIHESKIRENLNQDARMAIQWLFFPGSVFPLYASLIGMEAQSIRENLLSHRYKSNKMLTSEHRRIIALRLQFEKSDNGPIEESYDADATGVQPQPEGSRGSKSPGKRRADMERKGAGDSPKVPKSRRK